uniref:Ovule protein n=1 Tax=Heterorhabditis bacteriophora TaxID=37862 RepID=A0A1I7W9J7_HETBA
MLIKKCICINNISKKYIVNVKVQTKHNWIQIMRCARGSRTNVVVWHDPTMIEIFYRFKNHLMYKHSTISC